MRGEADGAVTVVIPVWDDYVRFLAEAVASVVGQGTSCEVVVVDNASDVALPILAGVTVVRAPQRLTIGAARNLGLAAVETPLVVFLDADDVLLPGALAMLTEGLPNDGGATALCHGILVRETGRPHRAPRPIARRLASTQRLFALANSIWSLLPTQGATIMRTDAVRAAGGYADASRGEEWELAACLAWSGKVCFGTDPVLLYRWRGELRGPTAKRRRLLRDARGVRRRLRERAGLPPLVRRLLPLIAVGQWTNITILRPPWRLARRVATRIGRQHQRQ